MNVKKSTAFTLLEIVIAMLILSMVTAGIFGLFVTSSKYIVEAGHRLQAINYARQVAENLKIYVTADPGTDASTGTPLGAGLAWSQTNPTLFPLSLPNVSTAITNVGTPAPTCTYTATNISGGLKSAAITVNWTES